MLNGLKEIALQKVINTQISEYGTVKLHGCDFKKSTISGDLFLRGEEDAVSFKCKYRLVTNSEGSFVKIVSITISREWMKTLANEYLKGQEIEIDDRLSFLIDL